MTAKTKWLERQQAGEDELTAVLRKYFTAQGRRVVSNFRSFNSPVEALANGVLNKEDEHTLLMDAVRRPLVEFIAQGAVDTLEAAKSAKRRKSFVTEAVAPFTLPAEVVTAIEASFIELAGQGYWQQIQSTTESVLTRVISAGIEEGLTQRKMATRLRDSTAAMSEWRSRAIARTETTGAYNAGHQSSYNASGATSKEWLSITDGDTRASHVSLDGVTVGVDEDFQVGSATAPYPGHHSLPAKERVFCRCTTAASFAEREVVPIDKPLPKPKPRRKPKPKPKPKALVATITADKTTIKPGDSVKVTWTLSNHSEAYLYPGATRLTSSSSKTFTPDETTTYRIHAFGKARRGKATEEKRDSVKVTVQFATDEQISAAENKTERRKTILKTVREDEQLERKRKEIEKIIAESDNYGISKLDREVGTARRDADQANKKVWEAINRKPQRHEEVEAATAERDAAWAAFREKREQFDQANHERAMRIANVIGGDTRNPRRTKRPPEITHPGAEQQMERADQFLETTINGEVLPEFTHKYKDANGLTSQRAYYQDRDKTVNMHDDSLTQIYVHEVTHHVEVESGQLDNIREYQAMRRERSGKPDVNLKKQFPSSNYRDGETGNDDDFQKAFGPGSGAYYAGKDYGPGEPTEMLTMAVERLYDRPQDLAKDPELLKFIIGTLDGTIGK